MPDIEKILQRGDTRGDNYERANEKFAEHDGTLAGLQGDVADLNSRIDEVAASAGKIDKITIDGKEVPIDESKTAQVSLSSEIVATKDADNNGALTLSIPALAKKATEITLSMSQDGYYKLTAAVKSADGTVTESLPVDLPLEELVVSGAYYQQTKEIVLSLKNNQQIKFSVADLVSGLVSTISSVLQADEIIVGAGTVDTPLAIRSSGKKIVTQITGSDNVPTDSAVKTCIDKNAFTDEPIQFSTETESGLYVKSFIDSTKIRCPLFVLDYIGNMVFVDWQSITNGWKLTSDVALADATAYFVSLAK